MISMKNEGTAKVFEGTEEVHEGTEEVQESTAQVHEGTAQVNEGTAEVNESTAEKIKVPLLFVKVPLVLSDILEHTACFIRYRMRVLIIPFSRRTPIDTEKKLGPEGSPVTDPTLYRRALPMHFIHQNHLNAMKRVLRYLRGTTDLGLQLLRSTTSQLIAYFLMLDWQTTLSRSSAEAEYHGVANDVAETSWIRNLFRELHTPLYQQRPLVYAKSFADIRSTQSEWSDIIHEMSSMGNGNNIGILVRRLVFAACGYYIWQERNERIFKDERNKSNDVFNVIVENLKCKLLSITVKDSNAMRRMKKPGMYLAKDSKLVLWGYEYRRWLIHWI
ncbi:ribonuclease H-like domain-containing protein [Tanacetum coccineum]|uniref:Ribonuclease H-like domain-containing protein n=1 Tax=Tanacetum coccineum TaxID=301880 RepID=A0ABQ4YVA5_9ASTR